MARSNRFSSRIDVVIFGACVLLSLIATVLPARMREPTAEQIKIQIGSAAPVGDEREMEVKGRDLVSGIPKTVRVHSSEIREAIKEPIQQIVDAVRRALEITPPELASDIVDRGIVMTGGGALIRGLDLLLSQETSLPIHVDEDPLTCVVRGTGRILDDEEKYWSVLSA